METPKTNAGRLTERIMLSVRAKLPDIKPDQYNRIYESVLAELELAIGSSDAVKFPSGGGMFVNRKK